MKKNLKQQVLKRLEKTRCAELVAQPGRLHTKPDEVGAFLRRARVGGGDLAKSARIMAAAQLLQERQWAEVAHSALIALRRIFGVDTVAPKVRSVKKGKVQAAPHGERADLARASEMLRALLEFLNTSTVDAIAAHLILTSGGKLRAEEDPHGAAHNPKRIPDERPVEIWAKPTFYNDNPLARLHR